MIPEWFQMSLRHLATTIFDACKRKQNNAKIETMKWVPLMIPEWFQMSLRHLATTIFDAGKLYQCNCCLNAAVSRSDLYIYPCDQTLPFMVFYLCCFSILLFWNIKSQLQRDKVPSSWSPVYVGLQRWRRRGSKIENQSSSSLHTCTGSNRAAAYTHTLVPTKQQQPTHTLVPTPYKVRTGAYVLHVLAPLSML